jgi:hypothetical protein
MQCVSELRHLVRVHRSAELGVQLTGAHYRTEILQKRLAIAERSVTLDAAALRKGAKKVR